MRGVSPRSVLMDFFNFSVVELLEIFPGFLLFLLVMMIPGMFIAWLLWVSYGLFGKYERGNEKEQQEVRDRVFGPIIIFGAIFFCFWGLGKIVDIFARITF